MKTPSPLNPDTSSNADDGKKSLPPDTRVYRVAFDYEYSLGLDDSEGYAAIERESDITGNKWLSVARIHVQGREGLLITDNSKTSTSDSGKDLFRSTAPRAVSTGQLIAQMEGSNPIHFSLDEYGTSSFPRAYTRLTIYFLSDTLNSPEIVDRAMKFANLLIAAYRVASGDPVPRIIKSKPYARYHVIHYFTLPSDEYPSEDTELAEFINNTLRAVRKWANGGALFGFLRRDIDLAPKKHSKVIQAKTLKYSLSPEESPLYNDAIVNSIQRAHVDGDYQMAVIELNQAFEGAVNNSLIVSLLVLDKGVERVKEVRKNYRGLDELLRIVDPIRHNAERAYGLEESKNFRGSGEEGQWRSTTYKHRHAGVHIVDDAVELDSEMFKKALKATQAAIALLSAQNDRLIELKKSGQKPDMTKVKPIKPDGIIGALKTKLRRRIVRWLS